MSLLLRGADADYVVATADSNLYIHSNIKWTLVWYKYAGYE